jgi:uncharacterized protein with GYD domain
LPPWDQLEKFMITHIGLMSFTDKGIQGVKDTTQRAAAAKEAAKKFGVNLRDIFWTTGECDIVCVLEADDENAPTAFSLATAMQGNVRSRSLRAYTATEMDKILAKLPEGRKSADPCGKFAGTCAWRTTCARSAASRHGVDGRRSQFFGREAR